MAVGARKLRPVGVAGGHAKHHTTSAEREAAKRHRMTDAGRQARKFYHMRPEVKAHEAVKRELKKRLTGRG